MALSCGKKLRALLKEIASKHHSDFYCLNFFHYFRTENKLKSYKKVFENNFFCNILMSSEDTKILGFNQCQKSDKASFIIYADLECLIEMSNACKKKSWKFIHNKICEQIPWGFSISAISLFKIKENNHDVYRLRESFVNPSEST